MSQFRFLLFRFYSKKGGFNIPTEALVFIEFLTICLPLCMRFYSKTLC